MYIVAADGQTDSIQPVWFALSLAVAAAAASGLGVFRRRGIVGPTRLQAEESSRPLVMAIGGGLAVWAFVSSAAVMLVKRRPIADSDLVLGDLIGRIAAIATMLFLVAKPRRMGISLGQIPMGLFKAMLGLVVVVPLMMLSLVLTESLWQLLHYDGTHIHEALQMLGSDTDFRQRAPLLISIVIAAPISEELFFRGCVQTLLGHWLGPPSAAKARWLAIVLTSILFAMVHPWWSWPPIFVLAVCLGYAYERTGNLWTSIALHAAFNAAEVTIFLNMSTAAVHRL
jgi:membrane protease YdiL (CAAX protease family)